MDCFDERMPLLGVTAIAEVVLCGSVGGATTCARSSSSTPCRWPPGDGTRTPARSCTATAAASSVDIWPRFMAKVALAAASLVAEDAWIVSDQAALLRDVLWAGHPSTREAGLGNPGRAWSLSPAYAPPGTMWVGMGPGKHSLTLRHDSSGVGELQAIFFGDLLYTVPSAAAPDSQERHWRL